MPDLLLEIGLEEVPARMIASAEAELLRRTLALLGKEALLPSTFDPLNDAKSYSTPRRLAVIISGVITQQPDLTEDVTGPAVKIAYKDGVPTPAAEAFARKNGIAVADLKTISTPKGDYLSATTTKKGRSSAEVLTSELPKEIAAIYWAKNMRWIPEDKLTFVRPVLWLACLLGDTVVPIEFGGRTAARVSYGHRVLSTGEAFEIQTPDSYLAQLEGEYVLADVEARRHKIRKALDHVTRTVHASTGQAARWREDHPLVDKMTHLTEWPDVLLGNFEPSYLELPEEVLVTVMRDHQNYFALEGAPVSGERAKLLPNFLAVTNIALTETNTPIIKQGNERVLKARFNDAKFFWDFDQKTPLIDRVKLLENVTFQKDLGSYAKKSERVREICHALGSRVPSPEVQFNFNALLDAAALAKTDLTTELVKEFTELQGIIGGLYFKNQADKNSRLSEDKDRVKITWQAIYDQYLPATASDPIPRSLEGCVLGIADRIDTISGMFGLGMEPTGSKDPFALRRAANAIVTILVESKTNLPLLLSEVISAATPKPEIAGKLAAFFRERIDFYLRERHLQAYDVVKAVMAAGSDDLPDLMARANAVSSMRGSEDFLAVSAAFKRMKNILTQANFKQSATSQVPYSQGGPESNLMHKSSDLQIKVDDLRQRHAYREALEAIATIRPEVDAFFEQVMVMDPDLKIRQQRLTILATVVYSFSNIADFSEIVTAG